MELDFLVMIQQYLVIFDLVADTLLFLQLLCLYLCYSFFKFSIYF